jgi:glycosyltransferase involved in cell wall biosynthesis
MKITVSCGRKFHADHVAAALLRRGALERVLTANPPSTYRRHPFPAEHIRFAPPYYLPALATGRVGWLAGLEPGLSWWASRRFDRWAASHLGSPDLVLAWAWSARSTFDAARRRGICCVLEESGSANAHQEALLAEEHDRLGLRPRRRLPPAVIDNERRECEAADAILCPSDYVARSYSVYGVAPGKCVVLPYAANAAQFSRPKPPHEGPLRVLYVGSLGVRKGVLYLLRALALLPRDKFECTVIGRIDPGFAPLLAPHAHLFHHIPSVPYVRMAEYYQRASVLVLPTLDEGMANVILEALCSGTAVITTPHSGAEGMVRDDHNGYLVGIRDPEAIAARLLLLADDPALRARLGAGAAATVSRWTWDDYAEALVNKLTGLAAAR